MSLTDWGRGLTMKENRLGPMGRNIPAEVGGMSVEYQVQMVYRQEDVAALDKVMEFRRRPEKNLRLARKIGYPIFGLLLLGVGASIIAGIVTTGAFAPITIVTLVLSALCILGGIALLRRSDSRGMARRSWARYPNKGMTLTYTFYKDHFEETDAASGQHTFPYISIKSANEDAGHFFLFTVTNAAHMLCKESFVQGDPATFAAFLRKKAAVTMDPVE